MPSSLNYIIFLLFLANANYNAASQRVTLEESSPYANPEDYLLPTEQVSRTINNIGGNKPTCVFNVY